LRSKPHVKLASELESSIHSLELRKLIVAVVKRALLDIINDNPIGWDAWNNKRRSETVKQAREWIESSAQSNGVYFTFEQCCSVLKIDPGKIREKVKDPDFKLLLLGLTNKHY
jgi:hypothetical protein